MRTFTLILMYQCYGFDKETFLPKFLSAANTILFGLADNDARLRLNQNK